MRRLIIYLGIIFLVGTIVGCSAGKPDGITAPGTNTPAIFKAADTDCSTHSLWGIWAVNVDVQTERVEVVPMRGAEMHLNALHFLEPPAGLYLTLESPPQFSQSTVEVDIGLRHPFLGLDKYTGFDVCGTLMSSGSYTINDNGILRLGYEGDVHLENADGLTRWWNPDEFPYNPANPNQSYVDGLLGYPDATYNFNSNLNGYKYFADELAPEDSVTKLDPAMRGYFSAGQKNIRHYVIKFPSFSAFRFNYAVDASWAMPANPTHPDVPADFPLGANKREPYHIEVREITNTLYYIEDIWEGGGNLEIEVDAYQWFPDEMASGQLTVVGLEDATLVYTGEYKTTGANYKTYSVDFSGLAPNSLDDIDFVIIAPGPQKGYQGILPGQVQADYAVFTAEVEPGIVPTPTEWPMYQHDARHSAQTNVIGPQTNHVAYTQLHKSGNAVTVLTGPGEDIYCTFFGSIYDNRPLQAVKRIDGSLHWMQDFSGPQSSWVETMCIDPVDGWIYAYYSGDNTIHKLNPTDGADVTTPLAVNGVGAGQSGVIHENGYIYISSSSQIICLGSDLQFVWATDVESTSNAIPAIDLDGNIVAYGGVSTNYIYWLDPLTGGELHKYPIGYSQATPMVMSDNTVVISTNSGAVYAINPDASLKWQVLPLGPNSGAGITAAGEGVNGDVYVVLFHWSAWDEQLVRLNPDTGATISSTGTSYDLQALTSLAIDAEGTVYCNGSYKIFAFNPDLSLKWQSANVGSPMAGQAMGSCAIDAAGDLYAASGSDGFVCIRDE